MSCRCERITKLCRELQYLDDIKELCQQLATKHNQVSEDLDDTSSVIHATLVVPDEKKLTKDIIQLNRETATGINSLYKDLDTAYSKVYKLLDKAEREDAAFHKKKVTKNVMMRAECVAFGGTIADPRDFIM